MTASWYFTQRRCVRHVMAFVVLSVGILPSIIAAEPDAAAALSAYRVELDAFRKEFGGTRPMPDAPFFLFGMGLRTKLIFKNGALLNAQTGAEIQRWDGATALIVPPEYTVQLALPGGGPVRIIEDETAVWIEERGTRKAVPGTESKVILPAFADKQYPRVLRVLLQEILVNVMPHGPVPNFFVYRKPWYRDGAMMALCLKATGNEHTIKEWALNIAQVYDRNNNGETEADNPGQALFLLSLFADKNHPLVKSVLAELPRFTVQGEKGPYIKGRSDFAEHAAYQTKWLKYGLRALKLEDTYVVPPIAEGYSALFWMDYKETYVKGRDSDDRGMYPYLGWAVDHLHGQKRSPISDRDYPLTWEQNASQASYAGMKLAGDEYVAKKLSMPHTWHAAEVFLYVLELKR